MAQLGMARAHSLVSRAIKKCELPPINKHTKCVDCGEPAKHYDHRDYSKPLAVEAVCQSCNIRRGPGMPNLDAKPIILSMERTNLYLTEGQRKALAALAKKTGLSIAELVRRAIDAFLTGK